MLLLYFRRVGGVPLFSCNQSLPSLLYLFYHFFVQSRNSVIFVFSFLVVNLIVSVSSVFFPLYLCIGDKGGERAVIAVCVSSFHFIFLMRGIRGLGVLTPCFSDFFFFVLILFL